jgi:dynein heavy chain
MQRRRSKSCVVPVFVLSRWKGLKKKMLNRREQLAALQQAEAVEIRRKSDAFAERVEEFRK